MRQSKRDIYSGAALLVLGCVWLIFSFSIQLSSLKTISSRALPTFCGIALVLLGTAILIRGLRARAREAGQSNAKESLITELLILLILGGAVLLMEWFGFAVAAVVFLFAGFWVLDPRKMTVKRGLVNAVLSLVIGILVYYIFTKGFMLMLPGGRIKLF